MKAELLSLLTAKSMKYEISSGNHDAITSEDISHFLGSRGLDNREYDFLMAKYTENDYARGLLFDDIYEEVCSIFLKYIDASKLREDRYIVRHFINLALREVIYPHCFVCGELAFQNAVLRTQIFDTNLRYMYLNASTVQIVQEKNRRRHNLLSKKLTFHVFCCEIL